MENRNLNKGLVHGSKIKMSDNTDKNIEDVVVGDVVLSYNETTKMMVNEAVIGIYDRIAFHTIKYILNNGTTIECSHNHPFYTNSFELASWNPSLSVEDYDLSQEPLQIRKNETILVTLDELTNSTAHEVVITDFDFGDETEAVKIYHLDIGDNKNCFVNGILTRS